MSLIIGVKQNGVKRMNDYSYAEVALDPCCLDRRPKRQKKVSTVYSVGKAYNNLFFGTNAKAWHCTFFSWERRVVI